MERDQLRLSLQARGMLNHSWRSSALWLPWVLSNVVLAAWLAWQSLAFINFHYGVWYDWLSIDQTIEKYGPQNRYKKDFTSTTRQERERLFAEVVTSIQNSGKGLAAIRYHAPSGAVIDTLFTADEVGHLEDVGKLVARFDQAAFVCAVTWLTFLGLLVSRRLSIPSWKRIHSVAVGFLVLLIALIFIIGPKAVFYWLHSVVFPPDHPWFFYYQDSLMATFMKAPDIFGAISVEWFVVAIFFYWALRRVFLRMNVWLVRVFLKVS